jgi:hypothetical protein
VKNFTSGNLENDSGRERGAVEMGGMGRMGWPRFALEIRC